MKGRYQTGTDNPPSNNNTTNNNTHTSTTPAFTATRPSALLTSLAESGGIFCPKHSLVCLFVEASATSPRSPLFCASALICKARAATTNQRAGKAGLYRKVQHRSSIHARGRGDHGGGRVWVGGDYGNHSPLIVYAVAVRPYGTERIFAGSTRPPGQSYRKKVEY